MKALGVFGWAVTLVIVFGFVGCARTDFQAFDEFDESAGASGTDTGGRSSGGANTGGFSGVGASTGGFSGTSGTGTAGVSGTGGGVCRDTRELCGNECVLTQSDPRHCGECFYTCDSDAACVQGRCMSFCDGSTFCDGICTDITRDPRNCGGCGYVCPDNTSCFSGYCTEFCGDGFIRCDGTCVDWTSDPNNCGGCGYSCAEGQFCANGTCTFECPPGFALCGGVCTDLSTDSSNCGVCGAACGLREYCNFARCTPLTGTVTYAVGPSPLPFVSACGQPGWFLVLGEVDDDVASLMLPFRFRFYGLETFSAWVSSNGVVGFEQPTADFQNACVVSAVRHAVMAFWDDLATRQPGICVASLGASPNRQFVVTWTDALILGIPSTHLTFSVVLNEGSGVIDVLYGTMSGGGGLSAGQDATIGLASSTEYALDCCSEPCVMSNTGRRYTPIGR